eukprot:9329809-Lingulodinium_polyedra.AAC.1
MPAPRASTTSAPPSSLPKTPRRAQRAPAWALQFWWRATARFGPQPAQRPVSGNSARCCRFCWWRTRQVGPTCGCLACSAPA